MKAVKEEMKFAFSSYEKYAWGQDFLLPITKTGKTVFNGGITILDSLDTLLLMGLKKEYNHSKQWIETKFTLNSHESYPVFEVIIRQLGGLLSAYELTKDPIFLNKSILIADVIAETFLPTGLFCKNFKLENGKVKETLYDVALLSDIGGFQLEFMKLAQLTNNTKYSDLATKAHVNVFRVFCGQNVYPTKISAHDFQTFEEHYSFDSTGDSFYEYLIKLYVMSGGKSNAYFQHYFNAISEMQEHYLKRANNGALYYIISKQKDQEIHEMSHLSAYIGAMLALGTVLQNPQRYTHLQLSHNLTLSFLKLYNSYITGLMPEKISFKTNEKKYTQVEPIDSNYLLRPEIIESLFILYRLTGRKIYRKKAWDIFKRIRNSCKTPNGYTSIENVKKWPSKPKNWMDSYFLAETLKYLYLIFCDSTVIPLSKYVFNTEGHPLTLMNSGEAERYFTIDSELKMNSKCLDPSQFSFSNQLSNLNVPKKPIDVPKFNNSMASFS